MEKLPEQQARHASPSRNGFLPPTIICVLRQHRRPRPPRLSPRVWPYSGPSAPRPPTIAPPRAVSADTLPAEFPSATLPNIAPRGPRRDDRRTAAARHHHGNARGLHGDVLKRGKGVHPRRRGSFQVVPVYAVQPAPCKPAAPRPSTAPCAAPSTPRPSCSSSIFGDFRRGRIVSPEISFALAAKRALSPSGRSPPATRNGRGAQCRGKIASSPRSCSPIQGARRALNGCLDRARNDVGRVPSQIGTVRVHREMVTSRYIHVPMHICLACRGTLDPRTMQWTVLGRRLPPAARLSLARPVAGRWGSSTSSSPPSGATSLAGLIGYFPRRQWHHGTIASLEPAFVKDDA